ncbi:transmembrane protein 245-like [Sarcoptes scabiei]|nr:transmembrane protein 245-like [Sarcoptes scabiei]
MSTENVIEKENETVENEINWIDDFDPFDYSLQISRLYVSLLEDYRYLMTCFQDTCTCHANFDYQFFFKKIESRYRKITNLVALNKNVDAMLNDSKNDCSIDQIAYVLKQNKTDSSTPEFISRVQICSRVRRNEVSDDNSSQTQETGEENDEPVPEKVTEIPKYDPNGIQIAYKCNYKRCEFISFDERDLVKHLKIHDQPDILPISSSIDRKDVVYVCDQCGKEFAGQKWLDNHIENVHAFVKIFSCDYPGCNYQSKFRCVMEDHRRRHTKTKDFNCTWEGCTSSFVTKRDMVAHVNFYHKGIKNYFCPKENCNASFKDSNRLRHHLYTHTGERPYKCDVCDSRFKQAPHLNKHKKIHEASGETNSDQAKIDKRQSLRRNRPAISKSSFKCAALDCQQEFDSMVDLNAHINSDHSGAAVEVIKTEMDQEDEFMDCVLDDRNEIFTTSDDLTEHVTIKPNAIVEK